mgnify:CR=1 FL=1
MKIIINTSSMVPIYEQIVDQIKTLIRNKELKENDILPSVRSLAKELKISALTLKKLMTTWKVKVLQLQCMERHYLAATNTELLLEEQKKELEADLEQAIQKGRRCGIRDEEIKELFELILEG